VRAIYISLRQHHLQKVAVRLQQMCCESNNDENDNSILLERILTKGCTTPEDLLELLRDTIPRTIMNLYDTNNYNNQLRLIVLDSVADLFRLDTLDIPTRSALLFQVTAALQDLVLLSSQQTQQPLSILVLNQVTANFAATGNTAKQQQQPSASSAPSLAQQQSYNNTSWIPALGLSWAHCVHSRYQVDRCCERGSTNGVARRRLVLAHSARHATPSSMIFGIAHGGCEMLPP